MKKIKITRNEVYLLLDGLSRITGLRDYKKAMTLVADKRTLQKVKEETEELVKICKPKNHETLQKEFNELKHKKAKEFEDNDGLISNEQIGTHVMLVWPKATDWNKSNLDFTDAVEKIGKEQIEIELKTEKLSASDFGVKTFDMALAEVLSYFQ